METQMDRKMLYMEMTDHLMKDEKPSVYFNNLINEPEFMKYPLSLLRSMRETEQPSVHHPEGNVWNHVLLVLDEASKFKHRSRYPEAFMWAALLHDIGKPATTENKDGKITSYSHDKVGADYSRRFLMELTDDKRLIDAVASLARWHMQPLFALKGMPYADIETMKKEVDPGEIALLSLCDGLGRLDVDRELEKEKMLIFVMKYID
ncbi:MAG: putative domain HDIG-containing protein [Firmicutes bacterium]|nr:putative domain HDIG-containing protein [Bacillota bacterium]